MHKRTSTIVAIKLIPIENDLDDSIKEISMMTGCDSTFIVQFHGSYLKDNYLWVNLFVLFLQIDIKKILFFLRVRYFGNPDSFFALLT